MKRPPSARKSPPKPKGRPKVSTISVQAQKQYSAMQTRFGLEGPILTFRDLRTALNCKYGLRLSVGTVYRMAHGQMPKSLIIRRALGLVKPRTNTKKIIMAALGLPWG